MCSHLLVEHVTAREVKSPKVVLVYQDEPDVYAAEGGDRGCGFRDQRSESSLQLRPEDNTPPKIKKCW